MMTQFITRYMKLKSRLISGYSLLQQDGIQTAAITAVRSGHNNLANKFDLYRGKPIMEADWDLLIVLDACRVDALLAISSEISFLPSEIQSRYSVGSASDVWMRQTFSKEYEQELSETVYVTANPNSEQHVSESQFKLVDEVWKTNYDDDLGTTPPRPVTDHSIAAYRGYTPDRLLVHYMQPHFPSIPQPLGFGIRKGANNPEKHDWIWDDGPPEGYTLDDLWEAYIENLRYVLNDVKILVNNVGAEKAIITADHGNAFGEWDIWGHPQQPLPVLRKVPWVEIAATDSESHEPNLKMNQDDVHSVEEKLRALGYRE